ncbi:S-formylglutathione hydrolase-like [Clytia hemisphaerica]
MIFGRLANSLLPKKSTGKLFSVTKAFSKMATTLEQKSTVKCFGGNVKVFTHDSEETKTKMTFAVMLPPKALNDQKCPVLYWLSGLTCTEQNFITKAGAQKLACELGLIIVCPDTSPRGCNIEGEEDGWDFGTGAGFYVDATEEKWKTNYRMFSYVTKELPTVIAANFPTNGNQSIMGHSMGGHGAIVCGLKNPGQYKSISAFAPICNPMKCPWGLKAFLGYLGENQESWKGYDSCELVKTYSGPKIEILSDQGNEDGFLKQDQLLPDNLVQAAASNNNVGLISRMQDGYDHSYYFIATFVEDHLRFHAKALQ